MRRNQRSIFFMPRAPTGVTCNSRDATVDRRDGTDLFTAARGWPCWLVVNYNIVDTHKPWLQQGARLMYVHARHIVSTAWGWRQTAGLLIGPRRLHDQRLEYRLTKMENKEGGREREWWESDRRAVWRLSRYLLNRLHGYEISHLHFLKTFVFYKKWKSILVVVREKMLYSLVQKRTVHIHSPCCHVFEACVCAHARVCTHSSGVFVVILSFCGVFDIVLRAFASIKASN